MQFLGAVRANLDSFCSGTFIASDNGRCCEVKGGIALTQSCQGESSKGYLIFTVSDETVNKICGKC